MAMSKAPSVRSEHPSENSQNLDAVLRADEEALYQLVSHDVPFVEPFEAEKIRQAIAQIDQ